MKPKPLSDNILSLANQAIDRFDSAEPSKREGLSNNK
jgi:hypothetical protein